MPAIWMSRISTVRPAHCRLAGIVPAATAAVAWSADMTSDPQPVTCRRATPDDALACHEVMWESVTDLGRRQGIPLPGSADEWGGPGDPLQREVARMAVEWWVAGEAESGRLVGFARTIERDGLFELTEFFVRPGQQSRGVGKALLERAFPARPGAVRSI